MERIVVIGPPGAGKSIFADRLGRLLRIDVFHLDAIFWESGAPPVPAEWAVRERELIEREQWILDGNYSQTLRPRLTAADTAVFLDFPTALCLARYVRRRLTHRRRPVPGMAEARRPHVSWRAVRGIVTFRRDHRSSFLTALSEADDLDVVVLQRPRDVEGFLTSLHAANRPQRP